MTRMQQTGHGERALERMLEVVIVRVHGLVIRVATGETFNGQAKSARHKGQIPRREHGHVRRLHMPFDDRRVFGGHREDHLASLAVNSDGCTSS